MRSKGYSGAELTGFEQDPSVEVDTGDGRAALAYVAAGVKLLRSDLRLYVRLVVLYSVPAASAGALALFLPEDLFGRKLLLGVLDFPSISFAPVVGMVAVLATFYGRKPSLLRVSLLSIPWLARYLWTNAHTSAIFWGPVLALVQLRAWAAAELPSGGATDLLAWGGWAVIALVAVYLHSRVLLAPYLAVHGDLPATLSAWRSWELTGRRLFTTMSTFLLSAAPVAIPVGGVVLGLFFLSASDAEASYVFLLVLPHLLWIGIQMARPLVIASAFLLYRDLWHDEQRRRQEAPEAPPAPVVWIMALTVWAPRLGRRRLTPETL